MYERKLPIDIDCGVTVTQLVIGGKWKPHLINCITRGYRRPADFQKIITGATKRVLTHQLNELEQMGVVRKTVYPVVPMKVEYFLTGLGESLVPVIRMMDDWGNRHRELFDETGKCKSMPAHFPDAVRHV